MHAHEKIYYVWFPAIDPVRTKSYFEAAFAAWRDRLARVKLSPAAIR